MAEAITLASVVESVEPTEYHYIVRLGDDPLEALALIAGTTLPVWKIIEAYYRGRMTVDEIIARWEFLTHAQVYSALAYYHDNSIEIMASRYAMMEVPAPTPELLTMENTPAEYAQIVRVPGVRGGRPVIAGTSLEPWLIASQCYKHGLSVEEIITSYPHLTPGKIYATLVYYHDHKEQIDQEIYEHSDEYWEKYIAPTLRHDQPAQVPH